MYRIKIYNVTIITYNIGCAHLNKYLIVFSYYREIL